MNIIWTLSWYDPRLSPYKVESWLRFAEVMLRVGGVLAWGWRGVGESKVPSMPRQPYANTPPRPRQPPPWLHPDPTLPSPNTGQGPVMVRLSFTLIIILPENHGVRRGIQLFAQNCFVLCKFFLLLHPASEEGKQRKGQETEEDWKTCKGRTCQGLFEFRKLYEAWKNKK